MVQTLANQPLALPVIAPTEEEWRAMTPAEREGLLVRILDVLSKAKAEEAQARVRRAAAQAQLSEGLAGLREAIEALLGARGVACSDEVRARLAACTDAAMLRRWLQRARSAGTVDEVFSV